MRKQQLAVDDLSKRLEENKLVQQAKAQLMKVQGLRQKRPLIKLYVPPCNEESPNYG